MPFPSSSSPILPAADAEWLMADGLGGFASGTVSGIRTRRYHALLLTATQPPAGRMVLVNGFEAWLETPAGTHALSSQRYTPDVVDPDGATHITAFTPQPWPRWTYRFADGTEVVQEFLVPHGSSAALVRWTMPPSPGVRLVVRPLLSGRDFHGLHQENGAFRFDPQVKDNTLVWHPYDGVPGIVVKSCGEYTHQPCWYRHFLYSEERARGLDDTEDLASPGEFVFDLASGCAELSFAAEGHEQALQQSFTEASKHEQARADSFASPLHLAAGSYLVRRGQGHTIIAGYPWFGDWGRDTFIALRGLCLATKRFDCAGDILVEWAGVVSEGMLPNRFPDHGEAPEFNSVDASLWYIIAVHDYLEAAIVDAPTREILATAVEAILRGYSQGTRFGIRLDEDGLLACGVPGVQLTWMDAKVGDWVVTPRIGKPVEIQALWINALLVGAAFNPRWEAALSKARASFVSRFWREEEGMLHDVVDANHEAGMNDSSIRPNQILAVGGLPFPLLEGDRAQRVVDAVERLLHTPLGLRSLAPGSPGYSARYEGGVMQRDGAYHQGTAWPWLAGPFIEAWLRVRGETEAGKEEARSRFLPALHEHLGQAGLGHVSEITDAESPFTPRGCPFQAWSLGEWLRIETLLHPLP